MRRNSCLLPVMRLDFLPRFDYDILCPPGFVIKEMRKTKIVLAVDEIRIGELPAKRGNEPFFLEKITAAADHFLE
jgi:hypothetical protein